MAHVDIDSHPPVNGSMYEDPLPGSWLQACGIYTRYILEVIAYNRRDVSLEVHYAIR